MFWLGGTRVTADGAIGDWVWIPSGMPMEYKNGGINGPTDVQPCLVGQDWAPPTTWAGWYGSVCSEERKYVCQTPRWGR